MIIRQIFLSCLLLGTAALIITNHLYSQPVYSLGVSLITLLQGLSSPSLDLFFVGFTKAAEFTFGETLALPALVLMKRRLTAFCLFLFLIANTSLSAMLKLVHAEPRPYWTHPHIHVMEGYCPKDYGLPSGHVEYSASVILVFILEVADPRRQVRNWGLIVTIIGLVCLSRLYLGHHSLDQVIYGLCLGLSMSCLYFHGLQKTFRRLLLEQKLVTQKILTVGISCAVVFISYVIYESNETRIR